ncbi:MAG: DUF3391 domain-containing protein [Pseudomonadales bacterium]|nr:DUF3391 domain-containing protein [Pseudomonadales bacterium]
MNGNSGLIEVSSLGLDIGMYVAALDRPWLETPFLTQGFFVESQQDIDTVAKYCSSVQVDPKKSRVRIRTESGQTDSVDRGAVRTLTKFRRDLAKAHTDIEATSAAVRLAFAEISKERRVELGILKPTVEQFVNSIIDNPDAITVISQLRKKHEKFLYRQVSTLVWFTLKGKQLAFDHETLIEGALGVAIMDVGMLDVPDKIFEQRDGLSAADSALVKKHPQGGLDIIENSSIESEAIQAIVKCHHERYDGSGYPQGLLNPSIPMLAQVAGISDVFDAMTTPKTMRHSFIYRAIRTPYSPNRSLNSSPSRLASSRKGPSSNSTAASSVLSSTSIVCAVCAPNS